jgi:hypothetical protein
VLPQITQLELLSQILCRGRYGGFAVQGEQQAAVSAFFGLMFSSGLIVETPSLPRSTVRLQMAWLDAYDDTPRDLR